MSEEFLGMLAALEPFIARQRQISAQAVAVFAVVVIQEGRPMREIAARLSVPPISVTRRVRELSKWKWRRKEGQGLVFWEIDENDTRCHRVFLTERGKEIAAEVKRALSLRAKGGEGRNI